MPMSGLEFILVIGLFVIIFWPSKRGKGLFQRAQGWFAPRKPGPGARIKPSEPARPAAPALPEAPVKPAAVPAVRVGRARRAYIKPRAGAAR
ncbi:MAG: hypothetical protein A3J27_05025 [Candidatus Tectomicrobia bacterium RIFCSPLOWO2_12_FULL_69_37]|nr:MAG: hypothetical protein A3J27_05025 [Candidatus Tectomicrobia bacterium RIFCSPLOWO2_12_FULL_69_37]OGL62595.1 MAG: hypothetical protein A3I72_10645 [Candidatus Tectomicrobia bacterium RIFCSPLOWO2_02_FULL_70_19]